MIFQVEHFLPIETTIINRIVIALGQDVKLSLVIKLCGHDSVYNWNILAFNLVNYDISINNWSVFRKK